MMTLAQDRWLGHHIRTLTTPQVLRERAQTLGSKIFLNYLPDGRQFTYEDIDTQSNRIANGFTSLGLRHGTHVACFMDNSPEQLLTYFALGKLGAVSIPLNTGSRGASLKYLLAHSDATTLVIDHALVPLYVEVAEQVPALTTLVVLGGDIATLEGIPSGKRVVSFDEVYADNASCPESEVCFDDPSYIIYTSGTTGPSKGVILTQAQCFLWGLSHAQAFGQRPDDIAYICLPMFHTNALQGATYNALMVGASIALQKRFSASRFWQDIRASGATLTNLLGSMVNILWAAEPTPADADNRLRMCMSAPIPTFGTDFEKRFGLRFIQSYSLTDFGPTHAYSLVDPLSKLGSCGKPRVGIDARIVDDKDFPLPMGPRGELVVRHQMPWAHSQGYYKMPEATVKAWRNGWFHTGDVGVIDEDGYFWFLDRVKDAIRRRGENISAYEVEQVLLTHPAVRDVAVFAVASAMSEDEVAAALVLKPGHTLDRVELIRYCQERMAYFMVPRFIAVMDDLPRNSSQKIEKFKLRDQADSLGMWDREAAGIIVKRR
jgi:crotonobetaine/carnitine-CoA ligase